MLPLDGLRVLDLSSGIAGPFCTKLLGEAGAEVMKVEPPGGDELRGWAAGDRLVGDPRGGPLYQYLNAGKASLVCNLEAPGGVEQILALAATCDIVVEDLDGLTLDRLGLDYGALSEAAPHAVVTSVSDWGRTSPWRDRPASDLILQAQSGSMARRGEPSRPPLAIGGRPVDWVTGLYAALSALVAHWRGTLSGVGEHVDVARVECFTHGTMVWIDSWEVDPDRPDRMLRSQYFPSVLPCRDGLAAVQTLTGQHWEDFCILIDHPEWLADESLYGFSARNDPELYCAAAEWSLQRSVDEVIELATARRVPAAPIATGATLPDIDQHQHRGAFVPAPGGWLQPASPFDVSGIRKRPIERAAKLGEGGAEMADRWRAEPCASAATSAKGEGPQSGDGDLPFAGLRIADFTGFYAASAVGQVLAQLGAEVIHIESPRRIDAFRMMNCRIPIGEDGWWESSLPWFQPNAGKLSLTLDLDQPEGVELARRLLETCDVVTDGFTPRVMEDWGLGYEQLVELRKDIIMLRMSSYGSSGPWRDRSGFAPTVEAATGLTSLTGFADGAPVHPTTIADPVATVASTISLVLALYARRRDGNGQLIDSPMTGGALAIGAEMVLEHSAFGNLIERQGNRSVHAAPQNVYLAGDEDTVWIAVAVETDDQWRRLVSAIGAPGWAVDPSLDSLAGRQTHHDEIDERLAAICARTKADELIAMFDGAGVPVSEVVTNNNYLLPELRARGFVEELDHPVIGHYEQIGWPARFSSRPGRWLQAPAPLLGQHNSRLLAEIGVTEPELAQLEADGIIGNRPLY